MSPVAADVLAAREGDRKAFTFVVEVSSAIAHR